MAVSRFKHPMNAVKALVAAAALMVITGPAMAQSSHCYWNRERGYGPVLVCESQVNTGKEIVSTLCAASSIDARCNTFRKPAPLPRRTSVSGMWRRRQSPGNNRKYASSGLSFGCSLRRAVWVWWVGCVGSRSSGGEPIGMPRKIG